MCIGFKEKDLLLLNCAATLLGLVSLLHCCPGCCQGNLSGNSSASTHTMGMASHFILLRKKKCHFCGTLYFLHGRDPFLDEQ